MDIQFIEEALNNWKQTGSVAPSSRFLVEKMLNHVAWADVQALELGAGDGVFTEVILEKMDSNSRLTSFEINENFVAALSKIKDERFTLRDDSVELLSEYDTESIDVIMSSLPITNFGHALRHEVLQQSHRILKKGAFSFNTNMPHGISIPLKNISPTQAYTTFLEIFHLHFIM